MFGIGVLELSVIFVVALLIFGPKRLPDLARTVGKGLAEFRRASADLRQSLDLSVDDSTPRAPRQPDIPPFDPREMKEPNGVPDQVVGTVAPPAADRDALPQPSDAAADANYNDNDDSQASLPGIGEPAAQEADEPPHVSASESTPVDKDAGEDAGENESGTKPERVGD